MKIKERMLHTFHVWDGVRYRFFVFRGTLEDCRIEMRRYAKEHEITIRHWRVC